MIYHKLITEDFLNKKYNQEINQKMIVDSLKECYKNFSFSTFPYITYNYSSNKSAEKFNSGNCIAMSMFLKNYIKNKYNVDSFLIPASIPLKYSQSGYLKISHVALAIPKTKRKIYIADPAFYFINPIKVRTYSSKPQYVFSKDIYKDEYNTDLKKYNSIDKIVSFTKKTNNDITFNEFQTIPKDTFYSECYEVSDVNDKWNYFLTRIINPDKAISNFFTNILSNPFIVTTTIDNNGICQSEYIIKILANDKISIQYLKNIPNIYSLTDSKNEKLKKEILFIENKISKFFGSSFKNVIYDYLMNRNKVIDIED